MHGTVKGMRAPPFASALAVASGAGSTSGTGFGKMNKDSVSPGVNPEAVATTDVPAALRAGPWEGLSDSAAAAGWANAVPPGPARPRTCEPIRTVTNSAKNSTKTEYLRLNFTDL